MPFKFFAFYLVLILVFSNSIYADQVVMTNGDRLTGKIIKKDGDSIVVETEMAGTVKIRWTAVEKIVSDEPLSLTLADGKIIQGKIETEEDKISIKTSEDENVAVDKQAIKSLRTPLEQAKFEAEQKRLREAKFTDFWGGTIDAGFSMTQGNSNTRTFTAAFRGTRETTKNKLSVYANALQVKNSTSGTKVTTAQSVWTGARYDINTGKKWFGFSSSDFEYNKPQKLNLRAVFGVGAGYRAVKNDRTNVELTFGGTHNYENFSTNLKRHSAELIFGEEVKHKLSSRMRLSERIILYPNLTRVGTFRALLDASLQTDINSWLGLYMTIGNRYNSHPVTQTLNNDFLLSTGLRVSFGKSRNGGK